MTRRRWFNDTFEAVVATIMVTVVVAAGLFLPRHGGPLLPFITLFVLAASALIVRRHRKAGRND